MLNVSLAPESDKINLGALINVQPVITPGAHKTLAPNTQTEAHAAAVHY